MPPPPFFPLKMFCTEIFLFIENRKCQCFNKQRDKPVSCKIFMEMNQNHCYDFNQSVIFNYLPLYCLEIETIYTSCLRNTAVKRSNAAAAQPNKI